MKNSRPTGVIRTLPYFGAAVTGGEVRDSSKREAMRRAYARMMRAQGFRYTGDLW